MSRIGKLPINVTKGVEISFNDSTMKVKGPKGELTQWIDPCVSVSIEEGSITLSRDSDHKDVRSKHGLYRSLINNMITGVSTGFKKDLELIGVGYRAQVQGDTLNLSLGFSHPVAHKMPQGVRAECPTPTEIVIKGSDKQQVGQVAAEVRAYRKPEPYKGKGVRYVNEVVVIKETKKKK